MTKINFFTTKREQVRQILEDKGIFDDQGYWNLEDDDIFADFMTCVEYSDYEFHELQSLFTYNSMLQMKAFSVEDLDFYIEKTAF